MKLEDSSTTKIYQLLGFNYNWYIFAVPGLSNFLTRDLVTLNYTLSISHSPHPLTTVPKRIAENMESRTSVMFLHGAAK